MDELYKEHILDHYKNPRNKKVLEDADFHVHEYNSLCGDDVEMYISLDNDDTVKEATFIGRGCAISLASASLLTEVIRGKKAEAVAGWTQKNIEKLLGVSLSGSRARCALLPLDSFIAGYKKMK
jgi:nitrogen fixation protein NifU and related proteins